MNGIENLFAQNFDSLKSIVIFIVIFLGLVTYFIQGFILNISYQREENIEFDEMSNFRIYCG